MELDSLTFQNPQWLGKLNVPSKRRRLFEKLKNGIDNNMIYSIFGIRRGGKSTLMKQLMQFLINEKKTKPEEILYFSFDEKKAEPMEVIGTWTKNFSFDIHSKKLYVFFDEIQKVDDWGNKIKLLKDSTNIKFILSGSASIKFKKGKESLAGREFEFELHPFDFSEWIEFKGIHPELANWNLYEEYLWRQLPELVNDKNLDPKIYIANVIDKIILHDIPEQFGVEYADKLKEIFLIFLKQPGQIIDYNGLAKDFDLNRETVSRYLDALASSFLLRKIHNFTKNARLSEKANKKFYPHFSSLISYIRPYPVDFPLVIETDVAFTLDLKYFWNERSREIDFLSGQDLDTGIEVKFRNRIDRSDLRVLIENQLNLKKRYVVTKPDSLITEISGVTFISADKLAYSEVNKAA